MFTSPAGVLGSQVQISQHLGRLCHAAAGIWAVSAFCAAMFPDRVNGENLKAFEITWSGASFGNTAAATAQITLDLDQVNNPGTTSGVNWVREFTITVTGATTGNGTWSKMDIGHFQMLAELTPLNFSNDLVGQNGWAIQNGSGGFGLYDSQNGAPKTTNSFTILANTGDLMKLTGFRPTTLAPGLVLQTDFDSSHGIGVNERVYALGKDSQGRLVVGGYFSSAGNNPSRGIARFMAGGALDPDLNMGTGTTGGIGSDVTGLVVLPDDSIVAVGDFRDYNGTSRGRIVKILPTGLVDETFANGMGADAIIRCVKRLPDGSFLIGGEFTKYDGTSCERLARLNEHGVLDSTFLTGSGFGYRTDYVDEIQILPGGKILAAGRFLSYQGHDTRNVMKLLPNGEVDTSFRSPHNYVDCVETMTVLLNGGILVGGTGGQMLFRLDQNGNIDNEFNPHFSGHKVYGVLELPDGKILVSGEILNTTGNDFVNLMVLQANGAIDPDEFSPHVQPNGWVGPLLKTMDGSIYVGGAFSSINGRTYGHLARFVKTSNILPDVAFHSATGTMVEGNSKSFEVDVRSDLANIVDFQITVEADDPAILQQVNAPEKFSAFPGQSKAMIYTYFPDNSAINSPRSFRLRITPLSAGARVGSPNVMTITVQDDDIPGTVFLKSPREVIHEGRGSLPVKVKRFLNDPGSLSVRLRTVDGTALAGRDYQLMDTVVSFPVGVYEQTVNISGPPNTPDENPLRRFTIELYNPAAGKIIGSPGVATIDVNDKDDPGSSMVDYTIPDPLKLVRFVDLTLDAEGVLYGLALFALGSPSAVESRIIKFSASGVGQVMAVVPAGGVYRWAETLEFGLDGKLYVSGAGFVFRYLPNGSLDDSWTNPIAYDISLPSTLQCVLPMPDGKLMIAGQINDPINGFIRRQVARIMPNGLLDPSFDLGEILPVGATQWIYDMATDRSGRLLIAGNINSVQGISRLNVVRVFADGTLDESFDASAAINSQGLSWYVSRILVTPDGKIYLSGAGRVIRVNADGSLDSGFPPVDGDDFVQQPDGKLVVLSGMRYDSSGQPDTGFHPYNIIAGQGNAIKLGPDGRIYFAGSFTSFDGVVLPGVAAVRGGSGSVAGKIAWESISSSVGEGSVHPVAKLLRLDSSSGTVGVHFKLVAESASIGTDVEALSGYHEFIPGETEYNVGFHTLNDAIPETVESFRLVLHDPAGGAALTKQTNHTVDIIDDDGSDIDSWIARFFPSNPLDQSVLQTDSDGDGMTAFVEWMTNSNPMLAADVKRPLSNGYAVGPVGAGAKHFGISFYHDPIKLGFRTIVERSAALVNGSWSTIWDSDADPQMESDLIQEHSTGGAGWMSVRSPDLMSAREFLRIRYERNP